MNFQYKLGFLGFGNMAKAISGGITKSGLESADKIVVFDSFEGATTEAAERGFVIALSAEKLFSLAEIVVLAIKPQSFLAMDKLNASGNSIISIMAGVTIDSISDKLATKKIARCMPNTPALLGFGMTAVDCSRIDDNDVDFVLDILRSVGDVIQVNESELNKVTAISGSGPAYAYLFIKGMVDKAVALGFDVDTAKRLVIQTIIGSCEMVKDSDDDLSVLIERVCSKGGTTIQAVNCFSEKGFGQIIDEAIQKCYDRAVEMSGNNK